MGELPILVMTLYLLVGDHLFQLAYGSVTKGDDMMSTAALALVARNSCFDVCVSH